MKKLIYVLVAVTILIVLAAPGSQGVVVGQNPIPANKVMARALAIERGNVKPAQYEQSLSSGVLYTVMEATGDIQNQIAAASINSSSAARPNFSGSNTVGCTNVFTGNGMTNTRVNQDCSLRRQAEEVVVVNPTNPKNLVAGQNDSRVGFNKCGYDWSFDGGKTWGDQLPPFYQFLLGDGHTADACSDPTATFDAKGNAYIGGLLFDINSAANAVVVSKSNAGIGGAFYHTPANVPFQEYLENPLGVVTSDTDPNIANDKEFIVADSHAKSPKANNVYATWTRFNGATGAGVGGDSPIFFSQSVDGGATWSKELEISGASTACTLFSGESNANACDQDQGSSPAVGPDGTVYVAFGNGNVPGVGIGQSMIVSCPASADCSLAASWTSPVRIDVLSATEPVGPDPTSGCSAARACLPPNGYRLDPFVTITASVDNNKNVYVSWSDFRNGQANCNPNGSAATATTPCNNDVFYAFSKDGAKTFSSTVNLTSASRFGLTAQWMPWSAISGDGSVLWVAFYDREYGKCESTGCNDITLAKVSNPASKSPKVSYQRITTASMPNLVPANNPAQAGFLGDYMWVTVDPTGVPLVVWADTRGLHNTVEEDIYFARGAK
jgi:hypothetical protein